MAGKKLAQLKIVSRRQERRPAAIYAEICETWVRLADLYQELGRSFSEARRLRFMTQSALAGALNITRDQVARYEIGDRWKHDAPDIERIVRFLDGCGEGQ